MPLSIPPVVITLHMRIEKTQMAKRTRTQQRFDELYRLAQQCHSAGWTPAQSVQAFQSWVISNPDLHDEKSIQTARYEYQKMSHPRLSGFFPAIRKLAQDIMDKEVPGTTLRLNHEFFKICRIARDHLLSVSAAIQGVAVQLMRR